MARFGATDVKDRIWGAAVYLFAIHDAMSLGGRLLVQFPALMPLFTLLDTLTTPIKLIYGIFNTAVPVFGSLIVFFILFLAVVRNDRIPYFIRFNTLQSILFGIAISLISIVFGTFGALGLIGSLVFVLATGASLFCIVQCALGRYPEIPSISAAVYSQLPR
ncbi:MAG: Tic20 family protein [Cyanobacteria bacterium P01_E01_bin.35]